MTRPEIDPAAARRAALLAHAERPRSAQRRPQLAQDDAWSARLLSRAALGHLALAHDAQPFITPLAFWYDADHHWVVLHGNAVGRMRAHVELSPVATFEVSRVGRPLPSNEALEFSVQYESVVAYGAIEVLTEAAACRDALTGLIDKYYPGMTAAEAYRPITDAELRKTAVYVLRIEEMSGKRNWPERADQGRDWPPLDERWFEAFAPLPTWELGES